MIDFKGYWDEFLPLIEFSYNDSYHSSIRMDFFESVYGRRYRYPVFWFEVGQFALIGPKLIYKAIEKICLIIERLIKAQNRQKSYPDIRRRDLEFEVNDWVYLKNSPMKGVMMFCKKRKRDDVLKEKET